MCLAGNDGRMGFVSYSTVKASSLGQSKRQATGEEPDTTTLTVAVRLCPPSAVLFSVFSSSTPSRPSCPRRLRGEKASTLFSAGEDPDSDRPPHCSLTLLPDVPASCMMAHLAAATPFSTERAVHNEPNSSELNGVLGAVEPPTTVEPQPRVRTPVPHDGCPANDLVGPGALPDNW
ncbi:hypothetical protein PG985_011921 [Apiospora marii]|uniref:Uncharacterized protein n=1 Tax=Apiospora marii TaxID=335849 RepID=A0ABR1REU6_9PEZI